jgi:hypothetical protein
VPAAADAWVTAPPRGEAGATTTSSAWDVTPVATVVTCRTSLSRRRQWQAVRFTDDQIAEFSHRARTDLHRSAESGSRLIVDQKRRLAELERRKQKLIDAYMADAIPVVDLKARQARLGAEIADAKRLIQHAQTASDAVFERLEQVITLLTRAERLYAAAEPQSRQILNSAVFEAFRVDSVDPTATSLPTVADAPLTPVVAAVIAPPLGRPAIPDESEDADNHSTTEGSNLSYLAVEVGFEPTEELPPHTLSRRA